MQNRWLAVTAVALLVGCAMDAPRAEDSDQSLVVNDSAALPLPSPESQEVERMKHLAEHLFALPTAPAEVKLAAAPDLYASSWRSMLGI